MTGDPCSLFARRLGRYQAAVALEPVDRVPISGFNWFADAYSGSTFQDFVYDPGDRWTRAVAPFLRDFPEVDTLSPARIWGPRFDLVGARTYRLPGRDLAPDDLWQYVEGEYMRADEYDLLIQRPAEFLLERYLPRVFGELREPGSPRSHLAFLKSGMAAVEGARLASRRAAFLEERGVPPTTVARMSAPFDYLGDYLRGLKGICLDLRRRPDKVLEACEAVTDLLLDAVLPAGDRRHPIQMTFHKATVLSPRQFDTFYWPSLRRAMGALIEAGFTIRAVLEGDWGPYWHRLLELPRGKVLCDIDDRGDIFRAKEEIGAHQCLAGGVPASMLLFGTPSEVEQRVRLLCRTVGKGGGYIVNSGCGIPRKARPENYRAMVEAALRFGTYDPNLQPLPRTAAEPTAVVPARVPARTFTPWDVKLAELGGRVAGDEDLIRGHWEKFETMAFNWCLLWG
jgi:hypothetical protein